MLASYFDLAAGKMINQKAFDNLVDDFIFFFWGMSNVVI